jgi:hypothetical protein
MYIYEFDLLKEKKKRKKKKKKKERNNNVKIEIFFFQKNLNKFIRYRIKLIGLFA